jgi:hypothetical protein
MLTAAVVTAWHATIVRDAIGQGRTPLDAMTTPARLEFMARESNATNFARRFGSTSLVRSRPMCSAVILLLSTQNKNTCQNC